MSQLPRPAILDDFGLEAGLRWLCEGFTARTGIDVRLESTFSGRLADETETHLFRIAQEALTNVARHSGARQVIVKLELAGDQIQLSIADDGHRLSEGRGVSHERFLGIPRGDSGRHCRKWRHGHDRDAGEGTLGRRRPVRTLTNRAGETGPPDRGSGALRR